MMIGSPSSAQFSYEANHQRWKQVASYSGSSEVTEYIGGLLEKVTTPTSTQYHHYIPAGNNFVVFSRWNTGSNFFYYATQDHLGSTALLTDSTGARTGRRAKDREQLQRGYRVSSVQRVISSRTLSGRKGISPRSATRRFPVATRLRPNTGLDWRI